MRYWYDFLSLLFPNYCRGCLQPLVYGEQLICTTCSISIPRTNYHHNLDNELSTKLAGISEIKLALAYLKFIKGGRVQKLLHHLKYEDCPALGRLLGNWYARDLVDAGYVRAFDVIVPVPLHKSKKRRRGYNQSEPFASGLIENLDAVSDFSAIVRIRNTPSQTTKTRSERWTNVHGAFHIRNPDSIRGQRILIVDDIITTGATLEACAVEFMKHGAEEVSVAAIAAAL